MYKYRPRSSLWTKIERPSKEVYHYFYNWISRLANSHISLHFRPSFLISPALYIVLTPRLSWRQKPTRILPTCQERKSEESARYFPLGPKRNENFKSLHKKEPFTANDVVVSFCLTPWTNLLAYFKLYKRPKSVQEVSTLPSLERNNHGTSNAGNNSDAADALLLGF